MIYLFENITYNHSLGIILKHKEEFKLTKIQKKLLKYLLDHPQEVISKQVLMEQVWQRTVTGNSIDQRIANLRSIIELDPKKPKIISTSFGQGIFLNSEVNVENISNKKKNTVANNIPVSSRKLYLSLIVLLLIFFTYFIYWTQYRYVPSRGKAMKQISNQEYMNQFPVDKRSSISEMYAGLPKNIRKKFRRYLSKVSDKKKQDATMKLLKMTEADRIQYIISL